MQQVTAFVQAEADGAARQGTVAIDFAEDVPERRTRPVPRRSCLRRLGRLRDAAERQRQQACRQRQARTITSRRPSTTLVRVAADSP